MFRVAPVQTLCIMKAIECVGFASTAELMHHKVYTCTLANLVMYVHVYTVCIRVQCIYSGTPLIWTPLGQKRVSCLGRCRG